MEFLVEIDVEMPKDLPGRRALLQDEVREGLRLREEGSIVLVCGIPKGLGNVGIWAAEDEEELRAIIDSLPLRKYMTYDVTPLIPSQHLSDLDSAEPAARAPWRGHHPRRSSTRS